MYEGTVERYRAFFFCKKGGQDEKIAFESLADVPYFVCSAR
jgi:hypothetical protein